MNNITTTNMVYVSKPINDIAQQRSINEKLSPIFDKTQTLPLVTVSKGKWQEIKGNRDSFDTSVMRQNPY